MNTPPPADISKLKGILGNAKKLMGKVESGNYETGHVDGRALTEEGIKELQSEGNMPKRSGRKKKSASNTVSLDI